MDHQKLGCPRRRCIPPANGGRSEDRASWQGGVGVRFRRSRRGWPWWRSTWGKATAQFAAQNGAHAFQPPAWKMGSFHRRCRAAESPRNFFARNPTYSPPRFWRSVGRIKQRNRFPLKSVSASGVHLPGQFARAALASGRHSAGHLASDGCLAGTKIDTKQGPLSVGASRPAAGMRPDAQGVRRGCRRRCNGPATLLPPQGGADQPQKSHGQQS